MKKSISEILSYMTIWLGLVIIGLIGCKSRELEPGGPYSDRPFLFQADQTLDTVIETMKLYQQWAEDNPLYIAQNQKAQQLLEKVNTELDGVAEQDEVLVQAFLARDAYEALSSETNMEKLSDKLTLANALARQILPIIFEDGEI